MRLLICLSAGLLLGVAPARGDDNAEARKVLDKAVAALGGADKLAKVESVTSRSKGKITIENMSVEFQDEWSVSGTNRLRWKFDAQDMGNAINGLIIFDADKGWFRDETRNRTEDMPKEIIPLFREDLRAVRLAQHLTALTDPKYQLSSLGELKIGERLAVGIKVAEKDRPDLDLFFDKVTCLPLRIEVRIKEPAPLGGMEMTHAVYFEDYKDFDGLKHFTKLTLKRDDKSLIELELSEVKRQPKLDDSVFAKP